MPFRIRLDTTLWHARALNFGETRVLVELFF